MGLNNKQIQARLIRESDIDESQILDYCKSVTLSKEHLKTLNPEDEVNAVRGTKIKCNRCCYEHFKKKKDAEENDKEENKEDKQMKEVFQENNEDTKNLFINECQSNNSDSWVDTLVINNVQVNFKLDSGSDCSILPYNVFKNLKSNVSLKQSPITLVSYGDFKYKPLGEVSLECICTCKNLSEKISLM